MQKWAGKFIHLSGWAAAMQLAVLLEVVAAGPAPAAADPPGQHAQARPGSHDFDFLIGHWNVHHHRLDKPLVGSHDWSDFSGTVTAVKILGGEGNMDENSIESPGISYHACSIRAFDDKTGLWSIWWLDGRRPGAPLDPAVHGSFQNGVGTFYSDDTFNGRPIRVRYVWSHITSTSARFEQAFSADGGRTWETNWVMQYTRASG